MQILFTIAGLEAFHGGPSRSVPGLAEALGRSGVGVQLFTCKPNTRNESLLPDPKFVASFLLDFANRGSRWQASRNDFFKNIHNITAKHKKLVLHDNGLWLPNNHAVAAASRQFNLPLVISPRGMLSAWAMEFKTWKKRLAWFLYQRRDLQTAAVLHATSPAEANDFRTLGLRQPVAIIPNGVSLPSTFRSLAHVQPDRTASRTILFLSRVHPVKGIEDLLRAWAVTFPSQKLSNRWNLLIAGPAESDYIRRLKEVTHRLAASMKHFAPVGFAFEESISFRAPVEGETKSELYLQADLFVLPSHSENFGIAVAEALAFGVPVVTTRGTPWEMLISHRCGWWTDIGVKPLAAALREAMALTDDERREMGSRGRHLVQSQFSWEAAAEKMGRVYRWVLGEGDKPDGILFK